MPDGTVQRRHRYRVAIRRPVTCRPLDPWNRPLAAFEGETIDVSSGGVAIVSDTHVAADDRLIIELESHEPPIQLTLEGRVIRSRDRDGRCTFAVAFPRTDTAAAAQLSRFVFLAARQLREADATVEETLRNEPPTGRPEDLPDAWHGRAPEASWRPPAPPAPTSQWPSRA